MIFLLSDSFGIVFFVEGGDKCFIISFFVFILGVFGIIIIGVVGFGFLVVFVFINVFFNIVIVIVIV